LGESKEENPKSGTRNQDHLGGQATAGEKQQKKRISKGGKKTSKSKGEKEPDVPEQEVAEGSKKKGGPASNSGKVFGADEQAGERLQLGSLKKRGKPFASQSQGARPLGRKKQTWR